MSSWDHKLDYILDQTENIHRWYSRELGWCFITDRHNNRYRLDDTMRLDQIKSLIEKIKKINIHGFKSFQEHYGGTDRY